MQKYSPEVADKICYEVQMLLFAYDQLCLLEVETCAIAPDRIDHKVTSGIAPEARREASAWLECFLLHARILYDFFTLDASRPDDVSASHFVAAWSPVNAKSELGSTDKVRLNKALAHLTTTRIEFDQMHAGWDVDAIWEEICGVTKRFLVSLPANSTSWFEALAEIEHLNDTTRTDR